VDVANRPQRESFSGYYDRPTYDALFRWIDIRKISVIRNAIAGLDPGARILDLGCGSGKILSRIARPDDTAIAGDIDLSLLQGARARGATPIRTDFDATLPFPDRSLDAALIIDALEHTESPRRIIGELHRVLRPQGILIVFTPPYDSHAWIAAEKVHNTITRRRSDHISPFTRESLEYAVSRWFARYRVGRVNLGLSMYAVAVK
jgi:ubiquinone/menaquinone biosynthesis C-methylase UbiE